MLNPGQIVDRYAVEAHLGSGGMAEVYRVRHLTTEGMAALKVLKSGHPTVRERLLQEARVQAALRHPNAVSVTDLIDVDGVPGLVMEYVDGPTLFDWLQSARPDLGSRLRVFHQVLSAMGRAHQQGVIHRDLSANNILIKSQQDGPRARVTDFGIAKILDPDRVGKHKTRQGMPMGTPSFMAPEQVRDASDVDHRADIWALGCLLYLLATGKLAFDGDDVLDIFNRVAEGRYPPLSADLPEDLRKAIAACLQVDRQARPSTCAELATLLGAPQPVVQGQTRRLGRALALAALGLVAMAAVLAWPSVDPSLSEEAPVEAAAVVEVPELEPEPELVPEPAPEPELAPKASVASVQPAAPSPIAPTQPAAPPTTGQWSLAGSFRNVRLDPGGLAPGEVPPGTYTVKVSGPKRGEVTIKAGASVIVSCGNKDNSIACQVEGS